MAPWADGVAYPGGAQAVGPPDRGGVEDEIVSSGRGRSWPCSCPFDARVAPGPGDHLQAGDLRRASPSTPSRRGRGYRRRSSSRSPRRASGPSPADPIGRRRCTGRRSAPPIRSASVGTVLLEPRQLGVSLYRLRLDRAELPEPADDAVRRRRCRSARTGSIPQQVSLLRKPTLTPAPMAALTWSYISSDQYSSCPTESHALARSRPGRRRRACRGC